MAAGKLSAQAAGTIIKLRESGAYVDFLVLCHNYPMSGGTLLLRKDLLPCPGGGDDKPTDSQCSNYRSTLDDADGWVKTVTVKRVQSYEVTSFSLDVFMLSLIEMGFSDSYIRAEGSKIAYFSDEEQRKAVYEGVNKEYFSRSLTIHRSSGKETMHHSWITTTGIYEDDYDDRKSSIMYWRPAFVVSSDLFVQSDGILVENTPPVISGSNGALGTFGDTPPSYKYTVTDAQGGTVSVTEKVDSTALRTYNVTLGSQNTLTIPTATWKSLSNGSHTLTITAKDSHGATATRTQTFTKNATAPVISGSNGNLGSFGESGPTYQYTVTDAQGGTVTVAEKLDGAVLRTYTVTLGGQNTLSFTADAWRKILNGSHTLTITATDPLGLTATRTQTFTKNVTSCAFETAAAFPADAMPDRCIVNVQGEFPEGCTLKVEICNNGSDASPTWEDITQNALNNQKYFFTNKTKTASAWGVKLRATLSRGTASGECYISSLGGNFQ